MSVFLLLVMLLVEQADVKSRRREAHTQLSEVGEDVEDFGDLPEAWKLYKQHVSFPKAEEIGSRGHALRLVATGQCAIICVVAFLLRCTCHRWPILVLCSRASTSRSVSGHADHRDAVHHALDILFGVDGQRLCQQFQNSLANRPVRKSGCGGSDGR